MFREIERAEALELLQQGAKVYMIGSDDMRLADLDEALGQRLIADIEQVTEADPEPEAESPSPEKQVKKKPPHMVEKVCVVCGKTFTGGPASKKCPDCRSKAKSKTKDKLTEWGVDYGKKQAEETLAMIEPIKIDD